MRVPISHVDITPEHPDTISRILAFRLPDREVWAYGSRITGHSWRYSDLDLVVRGYRAMGAMQKEDLLDELSETLVPYIIELKDWHTVPKHWHDEILNCYAVIHSPSEPAQAETATVVSEQPS